MSASEYQAWLFDLDGTLYRAGPVRLAMATELVLFGWRAAPTIRVFRQQHEQLRQEGGAQGECAYTEQLQRTAEALACSADDVRRVVEEWMIRRPGRWLRRFKRQALIDQLTEYRRQGGRAAVVSDYPAREKLQAMGVAELFDAVIANGEHEGGLPLKPNPAGYLEAAKQLGIPAERCLVWGDRADADGAAAEAAGMSFRQV